jgi:hypothetical protein
MSSRFYLAYRFIVFALLAALAGGCAVTGGVTIEPPPGVILTVPQGRVVTQPARQLDIPPGHMPPPGSCRIWMPGVPPGQQSPPGDCNLLRRQVPPGGVLVAG